MELTAKNAEKMALEFFLEDYELPEDDRDFFVPLSSHSVDNRWYVVEIGVEGLPDKWIIQVYDETNCVQNAKMWLLVGRVGDAP